MKYFLLSVFLLCIPQYAFAGVQIFSNPGPSTFTVPAGVYQINAFAIGGGGGGGAGAGGWGSGGGGGCGGGVAGGTFSVSPGQQISLYVGYGGAGGNGSGQCPSSGNPWCGSYYGGADGSSGGASAFSSVYAEGGGWGRTGFYNLWNSYTGGTGGGSGGGGGGNGWPGYSGIPGSGGSAGTATNSKGTGGYCTGSDIISYNYYDCSYYDGDGNYIPQTCSAPTYGWPINPGTYITKASWSAGAGGYAPWAYTYWGGGGGGGVIINGSGVNGQDGQSSPGNGGQGYGGGGGGSNLDNLGYGGAGANGVVYVEWVTPPASCTVSLSPNPISQGSGSTLSWSSTNAESWVYINNVGYVGASGATGVAPSSSTDYSCYAQGSGGSDGWHSAVLTVYASCPLPWGGSITNGQSTTAYQASTVPYGSSCTSQTRSCSNGTLSGSYTYSSCSVTPAASCTLNGQTIAHGQSITAYTTQTSPSGQLCSAVSQTRTCTNGVLSGSASYQYASCTCAPLYSCNANTVTYTNSSCAVSNVVACTSPAYCSPGSAVCLNPAPAYTTGTATDGTILSGHLQAKPSLLANGATTKLYWNVSNVASCSISENNPLITDAWSVLTSGTSGKTTSALRQQTTYTLTCQALPGISPSSLTESVTVNVAPVFQEL